MKKHERITRVGFCGHGHYKITIVRYGVTYSAITTDMQTLDNWKDGNKSAGNQLYDEVVRKNHLGRYGY